MKIDSVSFLRIDNVVKMVVCASLPCYDARLHLNNRTYADSFNRAEPYDRKTHVFYLPAKLVFADAPAELVYRRFKRGRKDYVKPFKLPVPAYADRVALRAENDHGITVEEEETEQLFEGLTYTKYTCRDKDGAPVILSLLKTDLRRTALYIGTPDDGYEGKNVKATIPDMAAAAARGGKKVLAAVNGDFFDMFGDHHPSGLCVKNGTVISNVLRDRPFIGQKKDGTAVIADQLSNPGVVPELEQAAAGMQLLVKDGAVFDWAPLEPFSYVRHPRTAAGVTKEGDVLLLEVDGRIPAHSNGASLLDLARFMVRLGAESAINLDGGGSSAVYTLTDGALTLRTVPADLFFPNDRLIRKDFNALLIVEK